MAKKPNANDAAKAVEELLVHAQNKLDLDYTDIDYIRNNLLYMLKIDAPIVCENTTCNDFQSSLDNIIEYAVKNKIVSEKEKLLFETQIMGILSPLPSKVVENFDNIASYTTIEDATKYLNDLSVNNNYIRMKDINKNLKWDFDGSHGKIKITINLSKPEKSQEEVEFAKNAKTGYPKCLLCKENIGYFGNAGHPARQTLRTIPLWLNDEPWIFQFSPYVYFEDHFIAISEDHRPMSLNDDTFKRLLEFVEMFPHYFIGSNSPFPIVGGSILAHEHYQGGLKVLPIFDANDKDFYKIKNLIDVNMSMVDWYNSVIRLISKNKEQLLEAVAIVKEKWENYTNESLQIIASTQTNGEVEQHNTLTPICRNLGNGEYCFDLILRNNLQTKEKPFGVFNPSEDLQNIKKENIGIIEAMGLFILPGRLKEECENIKNILLGKTELNFSELAKDENVMQKHLGMIAQLTSDNGVNIGENKAETAISNFINNSCEKILESTAVFKNYESGYTAFNEFLLSVCE